MKLSFVVPCYNVESYLNRCLDSIYSQGLEDNEFEVIAVNDGSTDGSLDILKSYGKKNLIIVDQSNQGLSDARNNGLSKANGQYIWFVDSDDYIKLDSAKRLLNLIERNRLDILVFCMERHECENVRIDSTNAHMPLNRILDGREAILLNYAPNSVCACIYSKEFLDSHNELRFISKLYHQDVQFNYRAMATASRIMFIDSPYYIYDIRPNSISTYRSEEKELKRLTDDAIIAKTFVDFAKTLADEELKKRIMQHSTSICIGLVYGLKNDREHGRVFRNKVIGEMRYRNLFPLRGPFKNTKQKLASIYLNFILSQIGK